MEDLQNLSIRTPALLEMERQLINIPWSLLAGVSDTSWARVKL